MATLPRLWDTWNMSKWWAPHRPTPSHHGDGDSQSKWEGACRQRTCQQRAFWLRELRLVGLPPGARSAPAVSKSEGASGGDLLSQRVGSDARTPPHTHTHNCSKTCSNACGKQRQGCRLEHLLRWQNHSERHSSGCDAETRTISACGEQVHARAELILMCIRP